MPAYAYILRCADSNLYYGITNDLLQRLDRHARGRVASTARRRPVDLVYFEEHKTLQEACERERSLKNGCTRRKTIDRMIADFPIAKLAPFRGVASQG